MRSHRKNNQHLTPLNKSILPTNHEWSWKFHRTRSKRDAAEDYLSVGVDDEVPPMNRDKAVSNQFKFMPVTADMLALKLAQCEEKRFSNTTTNLEFTVRQIAERVARTLPITSAYQQETSSELNGWLMKTTAANNVDMNLAILISRSEAMLLSVPQTSWCRRRKAYTALILAGETGKQAVKS